MRLGKIGWYTSGRGAPGKLKTVVGFTGAGVALACEFNGDLLADPFNVRDCAEALRTCD
jgi:hypothetical protein